MNLSSSSKTRQERVRTPSLQGVLILRSLLCCDHESRKSHAKAVEAKLAKQKGQAMKSSEAGKALLSLKQQRDMCLLASSAMPMLLQKGEDP